MTTHVLTLGSLNNRVFRPIFCARVFVSLVLLHPSLGARLLLRSTKSGSPLMRCMKQKRTAHKIQSVGREEPEAEQGQHEAQRRLLIRSKNAGQTRTQEKERTDPSNRRITFDFQNRKKNACPKTGQEKKRTNKHGYSWKLVQTVDTVDSTLFSLPSVNS